MDGWQSEEREKCHHILSIFIIAALRALHFVVSIRRQPALGAAVPTGEETPPGISILSSARCVF